MPKDITRADAFGAFSRRKAVKRYNITDMNINGAGITRGKSGAVIFIPGTADTVVPCAMSETSAMPK